MEEHDVVIKTVENGWIVTQGTWIYVADDLWSLKQLIEKLVKVPHKEEIE